MSVSPIRSLGCEFKKLYYSQGEADGAAARLEERSEHPITSYFCNEHGGWHLTSKR